MTLPARVLAPALFLAWLWFSSAGVRAADVSGYSVLLGQFLNQTGPEELVQDPDFGFSILASVDLTDFFLVKDASFQTPDGTVNTLDDMGNYWAFLDTRTTLSALISDYGWGDYTLEFSTVNEDDYSCVLPLPDTSLPPAPKLVNFDDVQAVDPAKLLILYWDFVQAPNADDFVQAYITQGHGVVFSTPDFGWPGALDGTARSASVPSELLAPGAVYSLNLEITRLVSTNSTDYPGAEGIAATFSSTSIDVVTLMPPRLRLLSAPPGGGVSVEVQAEPGSTVVLQGSDTLAAWSDLATNAASSGTNVFTITSGGPVAQFFRAWQP